ncbi:hypothetical protein RBH26_15360 [Natronolimnohabitans sp. A-GB9]|uniref:hypothetical protein n=1 Tax=Natronolimnohabitans sp. A-GB9 TaxID=3069757 RepID=UPI0027B2A872|nr:hypothetical protein [Natronolimnohabitans sp. A-GB9]MDQ2051856.1 hypothetical protein [Natronolimnohabitans sp. A-GB9]
MRELRRCDFCGDDAVGTFAVLPATLEPTEAEQRRVVLCSDCKERLGTLLEPLLERVGADNESETESADDGAESYTDGTTTGDSGSGTVVASTDDATRNRSQDATTDAGLEGGITFDRSEPTADGDESETDGSDADADVTDDRATNTDAPDSSGESTDESTDESTAANTGTPPSNAYGKVVRLLRNREFPMERGAVESLAAGAYDLEADEVDAIIEHAIEQGEFVEKRGQLRRP